MQAVGVSVVGSEWSSVGVFGGHGTLWHRVTRQPRGGLRSLPETGRQLLSLTAAHDDGLIVGGRARRSTLPW
jgi:hypothetical protein